MNEDDLFDVGAPDWTGYVGCTPAMLSQGSGIRKRKAKVVLGECMG